MPKKLSKEQRNKEIARLKQAVKHKNREFEAHKNKSGRKRRFRMKPPAPYRSWYEVDLALDALIRGLDFEYEKEHIIWQEPAVLRKYKPDFFITKQDDSLIIVEAKGRWTAADRKKICYVTEQRPDIDLRMLFEKDNKLGKAKNSMTYSQWCERKGIKYAIGRKIPEEWLNE